MYPHQRDRLAAVLASHGLAALITTAPINIAWATSTAPAAAPAPRALVATRRASVLLAEAADPDADLLNADDVVRYGAGGIATLADALAATMEALAIAAHEPVALETVAADGGNDPALRTALGRRDVIAGAAAWRRARALKSPFELECLERGLGILEESLNAAVQVLAPGMTAHQTVEICRKEAARGGVIIQHAVATATKGGRRAFRAGDVLRLELSGFWRGYFATVARAAVVGKPAPAQERAHAILEERLAAAVRSVAPGVRLSSVLSAAAGSDPGVVVTGGGIGLEAEEVPALGSDADEALEPGMVLVIAAAAPGGVRLVDTVLVMSRAYRRLNRSHAALVALD